MNTDTIQPQGTDVETLHRQAIAQLNKHQLEAAKLSCEKIIQQSSGHADAHFLLGMIEIEVSETHKALDFIDKAIELSPDRAEYHAHRGRCLTLLNRNVDAVKAVERALKLKPDDALTFDTIGVVCSSAGDHSKAVEAYEQAVSRSPDTPGYQFNLGAALKFLGKFAQAETAFEAAIARSPKFYKAHSSLSQLQTWTSEKNHITRLEGLVGQCGNNVAGELQLRQALAKEHEDLGHFDEAFENLSAGKSLRRRHLDYSIDKDRGLFAEIQQQFDGNVRFTGKGCPSDAPIFIVGMPRTGTTLVERILTCHSAVHSAGELQALALNVKIAAGTHSQALLDPETVRHAMGANIEQLGQDYLTDALPRSGNRPHFVDKMPMNFLYIGFIRHALPGAKIISLRRNPLDSCLSNFRQFFDPRFTFYNYSYDLLDTGHYYVLFDQLMSHWNQLFPEQILEVHYEDVVADQSGQSRRIIEYCGLEWEDACLDFERNTAPVATASSVQVRRKLYSHAVQRWQHYDRHLDDLKALLTEAGIEW